jgi:hypothetical protein
MLSVDVVELHKSPTANLAGWIGLATISDRFHSAIRHALGNSRVQTGHGPDFQNFGTNNNFDVGGFGCLHPNGLCALHKLMPDSLGR